MKNLSLLLLVLVSYIGCKKNESELPELTHVGANTFGCKVNGMPFVANGNPNSNWGSVGVDFQYHGDPSILISAHQGAPKQYIDFRFRFNDSVGVYHINDDDMFVAYFRDLSGGSTAVTGSNEYKSNSLHTGVVQVSYYAINIISGTFAFDAVNDSGQVVHITDGRFDIAR